MQFELIRTLRKSKKMTLVEFSSITGYTPSFLSQIERGLKVPSLEALRKIANALDISVVSLIVDPPESPFTNPIHASNCSIIHSDQRRSFTLEDNGAEYELITPQIANSLQKFSMYGIIATIKPGLTTNENAISHPHEECCLVLSGRMRAFIENEQYDLNEGDSIYIKSYAFHNYMNISDENLVIINFQSNMIN